MAQAWPCCSSFFLKNHLTLMCLGPQPLVFSHMKSGSFTDLPMRHLQMLEMRALLFFCTFLPPHPQSFSEQAHTSLDLGTTYVSCNQDIIFLMRANIFFRLTLVMFPSFGLPVSFLSSFVRCVFLVLRPSLKLFLLFILLLSLNSFHEGYDEEVEEDEALWFCQVVQVDLNIP